MDSIVSEKIRERARITSDDDGFRFRDTAEYLLKYIISKKFPISVGIYGKWGSGKTVFINFMKDAGEAHNQSINNGNEAERLYFHDFDVASFKNSGKDVFWYLLGCLNAKKNDLMSIIQKIIKYISPLFKKINSFVVNGASIDGPGVLSGYLQDKELRSILVNHIGKSNKGRNIVVIDNLDRLQPSEAVVFLEKLKAFLMSDGQNVLTNFAYIILCDFEIISKEVRSIYGESIDVRDYLNKLIEVPFYMPGYKADLSDRFVGSLLGEGIDEKIKKNICQVFRIFKVETPRDIKNFLMELDMLFVIAKSRGYKERSLLASLDKLLVIQIIKAKYINILYLLKRINHGDSLFTNMSSHNNLIVTYENLVNPGHARDIEEIRKSRNLDDLKNSRDIRTAFEALQVANLIVGSDPTFSVNVKEIRNAINLVDDVTTNTVINADPANIVVETNSAEISLYR